MTTKEDAYEVTRLSPAPAMAQIAINCAACPLDVATAAMPPSRAAMRLSKIFCNCTLLKIGNSGKYDTYNRGISHPGVDVSRGPGCGVSIHWCSMRVDIPKSEKVCPMLNSEMSLQ